MSTSSVEHQNPSGANKTKPLLIIIGLLALTILVILFLFYQNNQAKSSELQSNKQELTETYNKLESISNELDLKIEEIQKLGGDVEELRLIRETLEMEKEQLQNESNLAKKQYTKIRNRVDGYRELLVSKDTEISELKRLNEVLYSENTELKEEQKTLNKTLSEIELDKQTLAKKVAQASQLEAENIKVIGLNSRGKGKERDRYRSSQLEQLQITFNLAKNEVAPVEGKDVIVRVIEPDGNVVFDVARGSGTFMHDDKELYYTAKQNILFDNSGQELSFLYEKGSEYQEGRHTVEIYADDYVIGTTNFEVR